MDSYVYQSQKEMDSLSFKSVDLEPKSNPIRKAHKTSMILFFYWIPCKKFLRTSPLPYSCNISFTMSMKIEWAHTLIVIIIFFLNF